MKELIDKIKKNTNESPDILTREIKINNDTINIIFSETLSSSNLINDFILKPISSLIIKDKKIDDIYKELKNILSVSSLVEFTNYNDINKYIYNGFTVIIIDLNKFIAVETRASLDRSISISDSESSITGPKDSFVENLNINIGLIRKRIRSKDLYLKKLTIGKSSNTLVGICYMNNIVDNTLVDKVLSSIKNINIDALIDSSSIKDKIIKKDSLLPVINSTQRPDLVSMALMEGKVVVLVDNSPYALIIPSFFIDFFHTADDYYEKDINITFIRIIRLLAFLIAVFAPAIYVSVTTHNIESIPTSILVNFAYQRMNVPFSGVIEALLMIISFEILRESDTRIPSKMGSSVSILGGLVLGEAAVSAGIISPIMIIVIAISAVSGLAFSNMSLIYSIRYFRLISIFLSAFFGLYGVFISLIFLITKLCSIDSFGYPYMAPFSPFIKEEMKDTFVKVKRKKKSYRNILLAKKNIIRGRD